MLDLTQIAHQMQSISQQLTREAIAGRQRLELAQTLLQKAIQAQESLVSQQQQWRDRLASNTMSSATKTGERDDASARAGDQEVRAAQMQWMKLGPVPPEVAGPLNERFQRACRRFFDQRRRG